MATEAEKKLETKLKQLSLGVQRTEGTLESGKRESIRRHLEALRETVRETNSCKRLVESEKLEKSEEVETINNWNNEIDNQLEKADIEVTKLENWISEKERADEIVAQEVRFDAERKMHEKRLEMHAEFTAKQSNSVIVTQSQECEEFTAKTAAKLPKLVISNFDGSYMNWPKFWGQFTEAIDKSSIAPITKFTYLLELLEPQITIVPDVYLRQISVTSF